MGFAGCQEQGGIIGLVLLPHGEDDPNPDVGQCPDGNAVTLPLSPLSLIKGRRPQLLAGGLKGELVESVPERLDAGVALVGLPVVAALVSNGTCSRQDKS